MSEWTPCRTARPRNPAPAEPTSTFIEVGCALHVGSDGNRHFFELVPVGDADPTKVWVHATRVVPWFACPEGTDEGECYDMDCPPGTEGECTDLDEMTYTEHFQPRYYIEDHPGHEGRTALVPCGYSDEPRYTKVWFTHFTVEIKP